MRVERILKLALLCACLLLPRAGQARADKYEVFIEIETEEDLYDLLTDGQIGDDTFNTLLEIFQRGLDLNDASRAELYALPNLSLAEVDKIVTYRKEAGWIADPAMLAVNGIISDEKLLAIAPFLTVRSRGLGSYAVDGLIRTETRWSPEDDGPPPAALLARVSTFKHLKLGFRAVMSRHELGDVVYDPTRRALSAEAQKTRFEALKGYAFWDTDELSAIVGSYRIGFGQRLTFDNTSQTLPSGIYTDDELTRSTDLGRDCKESRGELAVAPCDSTVYVTPDYRSSERLFGVAVGLKQLRIGPGVVQAYGFLSSQAKGVYQYEIYDRGICDDPTQDDNPDCSAPQVYKRQDDLLEPTSRYSFTTLPDMYRETVAGANVSFYRSSRMHLGLTGYGASVDWLTQGIDLDFQEWSRTPYGGGYGAAGFDFAYGANEWLDLFGEFTQSVNNQESTTSSAPAGVLRAVSSWNKSKNEVEVSLRAYGEDFTNPYARPISAADEHDGLRARDEIGGRVRYSAVVDKRIKLRASADLWTTPSDEQTKTLLHGRADYQINKRLRLGGWMQFQDKGLDAGGRGQCFEVSVEDDENGEAIPCSGRKTTLGARARFSPSKLWFASAQVKTSWLDDGRYDDKYRKDVSVFATATFKPSKSLRIRGRARYLSEDLQGFAKVLAPDEFLEQSIWGYVDFTYSLPRKYRVRVRYDIYHRLDDRASTEARTPNPESWLWLGVESKF